MALHTPDSFLGSGKLLVRTKVAGVWGNYVDVGIVDKFEIKADAEKKDNVDKGIGTYGSVKASAVIPKPSSISVSIKELTPAMIAALSFGTVTEISISGSTTTVTSGPMLAGEVLPFPYMNVSAVSATGGGGALTVNEDFTVNLNAGYIELLTNQTSGVTAGFTYPDTTGFSVEGMSRTTFILGFLFSGKNLANDRFCRVYAYEATMMPKSALDFMGNDYIKFDLEGTLVTPSGYDHPFKIDYFDELGA